MRDLWDITGPSGPSGTQKKGAGRTSLQVRGAADESKSGEESWFAELIEGPLAWDEEVGKE